MGALWSRSVGGKNKTQGAHRKTKLLSRDFGGEQAESWGTKLTVDNNVDFFDLEHSDVGSHEQQESISGTWSWEATGPVIDGRGLTTASRHLINVMIY